MELVEKRFPIKELSDEGQLKAIISTFGQVDRDGDIMAPEAFAGSKGKAVPMVWSHNWDEPIGKGTVSVTDTEAIFSGEFFLDTARGLDAYKTVKAMGELQQYSIGFRIKEDAWTFSNDDSGGRKNIRTIKDLELFEASPVLVGAAYGTRTLSVKSAADDHAPPDIHEQLKALSEEHEKSCDLGDECPLHEHSDPQADPEPVVMTDAQKAIKELEAVLGYRPLIAESKF